MTSRKRLEELAQADPEAFRKLIEQVSKNVFQPHEGQRVVLDSGARFRVMNCGRRWGKTKLAAKVIVGESRKPNLMLWWAAPTYKVVKRGYAEVLRQIPEGVLTHQPPSESLFDSGRAIVLRFKNGTRMEFYSAERPEGMLGEGVDFVVMDEAAIMPGRIWNQVIRPTLMDREGGALMISTPRGRNWFYKEWLRGQNDRSKNTESWTFTSYDNPHLPPGEVDAMRENMPRMEFEQEVLAKFIASGSSVFNIPDGMIEYDPPLEDGTLEGQRPRGHVVFGIDLARTNDWTVIYGANSDNRRNCFFQRWQDVSWPDQKRRIIRAIKTVEAAGASAVTLVMDSTGVGDPVVEDMEMMGYDVVGINFTTHKQNMVKLLAKDIEEGHTSLLEEGIDEFYSYAMTLTEAGRAKYAAPEGDHDDVVSAKLLQNWGLEHFGPPQIRTISAESTTVQYDGIEDVDPWSDLVDPDDPTDDLDVAADAIGLPTSKRPSPEELAARGWF